MTKDLTNGEILVKEIEEIKDDFHRTLMFSGYHQTEYIEFSCNLKSHLDENELSEYFYKYCNFCGKFKLDEKLYFINRLDFIDENGKLPENYNHLHYTDSICESCNKNKYNNSIKPCKKCDYYHVDYKSKNICNPCQEDYSSEILKGFLKGYSIRNKNKFKKPKNKKNKKKIKKITKKNKIKKIKIIQALIKGYKVRQKFKPTILNLNQDCLINILESIRISNQKELDYFENIYKIGNNYDDEVIDLLIKLDLEHIYCGYCNKFVESNKFIWLDEPSKLYDILEFSNILGCSGICIYCNLKLLDNDLHYCNSCNKVSDLTIKDSFCPCIENKNVNIRNYDKITKYKESVIDKQENMRLMTWWFPDSDMNMFNVKIKAILNIPNAMYHNIESITRYLENWWWEIDAENCLCEDCRKRLLLENSDGDSDSDDDSND